MSDDEGHHYTFAIDRVPWHDGDEKISNQSKPYLEDVLDDVREYLIIIMSERHRPQVIWDLASRALRLIDEE